MGSSCGSKGLERFVLSEFGYFSFSGLGDIYILPRNGQMDVQKVTLISIRLFMLIICIYNTYTQQVVII